MQLRTGTAERVGAVAMLYGMTGYREPGWCRPADSDDRGAETAPPFQARRPAAADPGSGSLRCPACTSVDAADCLRHHPPLTRFRPLPSPVSGRDDNEDLIAHSRIDLAMQAEINDAAVERVPRAPAGRISENLA